MEILQHIWGSTPEGEGIILYTMRNSRGSEVQLCNIGASIVSVKFADRNGNIDDVALGYKEPTSYIGDGAASGKSVGRV
ncbi:MAG: galactose-1-epimerase, partial [Alistipes sp.]|nr:galactose-1-epimerase [Alistipes sp.]